MAERIEDYALLGDLQTAALVGRHGSVDWLPFPRFDSSSCFGAILGGREHGRWLLAPEGANRATSWRYRDDTLILETEWRTPTGRVRVIDFMPPRETKPDIVRIVEGLDGSVEMRTELVIRFDYGSVVPWVRRLDDATILAVAGPDGLMLRTPVDLEPEGMTHTAEFTVRAGDRVPFVLTWFPSHESASRPGRRRGGARRHRGLLARLAARLRVRRCVRRSRPLVTRRAQGSDVSPDRRDRRGADDVAARANRRRAELGLPLLLAP